MSDLVRTIIKWLLVIGIANRNSKKKNKNQPVQTIEKIKLEEEEEVETTETSENTLMVNLGDTAANQGPTLWIGIMILIGTSFYIYKNRKINEQKDSN